jgi:cell division septum initiation protein DivIVA
VTRANNEALTPQRVRSASFAPARLGRRGVDEGQVRAFCGWVSDEISRMLTERTELEEEVLRLRDRVLEGNGGGVQPEDGHVQAVYVLSKAQETADHYVASAQEYSREIAEDARKRREEILREARVRASLILEEAHASASQAAQMVPAAGEPLSPAEQRDLESEIAYLRTFSDVCRTHLRAYLDSLTRSIEEWERAEHQGAAAARGLAAPHASTAPHASAARHAQQLLPERRRPPPFGIKLLHRAVWRARQAASASPIGVVGGAWTNGQISSAIARQSAVAVSSPSTANIPRLIRCRIT